MLIAVRRSSNSAHYLEIHPLVNTHPVAVFVALKQADRSQAKSTSRRATTLRLCQVRASGCNYIYENACSVLSQNCVVRVCMRPRRRPDGKLKPAWFPAGATTCVKNYVGNTPADCPVSAGVPLTDEGKPGSTVCVAGVDGKVNRSSWPHHHASNVLSMANLWLTLTAVRSSMRESSLCHTLHRTPCPGAHPTPSAAATRPLSAERTDPTASATRASRWLLPAVRLLGTPSTRRRPRAPAARWSCRSVDCLFFVSVVSSRENI